MFIYTILLCFQIQAFMCLEDDKSNECEKQLTKTVIDYHKFIDPGHTTVAEPKDVGEDDGTSISLEVLGSFRSGLYNVIKQLSHYYYSQMPSRQTALGDCKNKELKTEVSKHQKPFETDVCLFFPRCWGFLNNFTNEVSPLISLYRLYYNACLMRPAVLAKVCTNKDDTSYSCDSEDVLMIHNLVRNFPDVPTGGEHETKGDEFISKAFRYVNGIGATRMLTKLNAIPKANIFAGVNQTFFFTIEGLPLYDISGERTRETNKTFVRLISDYLKVLPDNVAATLRDFTLPDAVGEMFTRALMTLVTYFRFKVYGLYDDATSFTGERSTTTNNREHVKRKLTEIVGDLCRHTALILVYLADHRVDGIAVPFGLHSTLCNNWMHFLKVQCPPGGSEDYERSCVVNAILDRLAMNVHSITGHVSVYDRAEMDYQLAKEASKYVKNAYDAVVYYYADLSDTLPVWTAFDWLVGHKLIFCRLKRSPEMSGLKDMPIQLRGDSDKPESTVTLDEAYDVFLPWHLDMHTILTFHGALVSHVDNIMDDFVYRHAKCIILYLEYVNYTLSKLSAERLSKSVMWYTKGTENFRKYLSLPGPQKPSKEEIRDVISAVQNLKYTLNGILINESVDILNAIPVGKQNELADWADIVFFDVHKSEYVTKLNKVLSSNCRNAAVYVKKFLSVAYQSKVSVHKVPFDMYGNYCTDNLKNIFGETHLSVILNRIDSESSVDSSPLLSDDN